MESSTKMLSLGCYFIKWRSTCNGRWVFSMLFLFNVILKTYVLYLFKLGIWPIRMVYIIFFFFNSDRKSNYLFFKDWFTAQTYFKYQKRNKYNYNTNHSCFAHWICIKFIDSLNIFANNWWLGKFYIYIYIYIVNSL